MMTRDEIARQHLLEARVIFIKEIKVCLARWKPNLYTFRNNWLGRKEFWVSIVGLPHHLWSTANARILVKELGAVVVEVDRKVWILLTWKSSGSR